MNGDPTRAPPDDWPEIVCSICDEEIGEKDNFVNFGAEEFHRWKILEEVCADCVIQAFRELDHLTGETT